MYGIKMTDLIKEVAEYFPYVGVRPFQDEFIKTVFQVVKDCGSVLIEGSNGLGKTIATLSACLPSAVEQNLKILYVARTHRQHDRVIEELKAISRRQSISGISLRGRHEMCLNNFVTGHALDTKTVMEVCELLKARGRCPYFRNIEEKKDEYFEILQAITFRPYKASEIQKICRIKGFCPYELTKASLADVNVAALSYLYVFDPVIRNAFLKNLDAPLNRIILIVDEAHNLPETAVEIASSSLSLFAIKQAELEAKKFGYKDIANFARIVRNEIEKAAGKIGKEALVSPEFLIELIKEKAHVTEPSTFFERLHNIGSLIKRNLLAEGRYPRSFIHGISEFLLRWLETAEEQSFINVIDKYKSRTGATTAKLGIVSLDPSEITAPVFSSTYSNIVMSGTLQPLEAYVRMTKLPEGAVKSVVPSPFPKEHILPLICCGVTTAMEKRTPQMYKKIIRLVKEVIQSTPANVGVFTASFEVLEALITEGLEKAVDKPLFYERRGMSSKENERMVAKFKAYSKNCGAVLLGVQGGRSSEGVDYPGDQMNSVVIVGMAYAEPTPKVKAQISYFEKCFPGLGREYGYVLPAMKKASQAAGRPIRTLEDKGAIIFLDYRFATLYCQRFLPSWIRDNLKILSDREEVIAWELDRFFKKVQ
jgi:DNA excision repair protein ERCC-2